MRTLEKDDSAAPVSKRNKQRNQSVHTAAIMGRYCLTLLAAGEKQDGTPLVFLMKKKGVKKEGLGS
jgi:hypothetical protein